MNLARFSVRRPVAISMLMVAIMLVGAICLSRTPVDLLPEVSYPTVSVNTTWPNVSPEEVELLVSRPLEAAVASAPGIRRLYSTSYQGLSQVQAEFERDQQRMHEYEEELKNLGIELKDYDTGLIDFLCWMDGREVYLCWRLGESEVSHWHEIDAGFAGRQRLLTAATRK